MKLGEGVEWAAHCAIIVAGLAGRSTIPGKALAEYHGVSETYLLKHLKALVTAGIFESVPGPRGGYRLARDAAEITLLDIVEAIDGKQPVFRCTEIRQRGPTAVEACAYRGPCGINRAMLSAEAAWRLALAEHTLASLAAGVAISADPRVISRTGEWLARNERKSAS
jgi:Rrf2 family protein